MIKIASEEQQKLVAEAGAKVAEQLRELVANLAFGAESRTDVSHSVGRFLVLSVFKGCEEGLDWLDMASFTSGLGYAVGDLMAQQDVESATAFAITFSAGLQRGHHQIMPFVQPKGRVQ